MAWPGKGPTARGLRIGDEVNLQMPNTIPCGNCGGQIEQKRNHVTAFYQGRQNIKGLGMCDTYSYYIAPTCPHCGETIQLHAVRC